MVGVELSSFACEAFFKENDLPFKLAYEKGFNIYQGEKITLFAGDIFELDRTMTGKLDAIFDRAALYALPSELRQRYVKAMINLLEPKAKMLLISFCYNQSEMNGPPFSVSEEEINCLYGHAFTIKQLYNEPVPEISEHHKAKGLTRADEQVYYLYK